MNTERPATRAAAKLNLLTAALNVAFSRGLIRSDDSHRTYEFRFASMDVLACVRADELEIAVWAIVDPTDLGRRFACCLISSRRPLIGAATAVGWLNRRTGRFHNVTGDFRASHAVVAALAQVTFTKATPCEDGRHPSEAFHRCNAVYVF
jgi:hypothetical protein